MNKRITALFLSIALACASATAHATEYVGTIGHVDFGTGQSAARVSINTGPHSSPCGNNYPDWFSYENADSGVGKIWTAVLLSAHMSGQQVRVYGTGTCDPWGLEIVQFISFL